MLIYGTISEDFTISSISVSTLLGPIGNKAGRSCSMLKSLELNIVEKRANNGEGGDGGV